MINKSNRLKIIFIGVMLVIFLPSFVVRHNLFLKIKEYRRNIGDCKSILQEIELKINSFQKMKGYVANQGNVPGQELKSLKLETPNLGKTIRTFGLYLPESLWLEHISVKTGVKPSSERVKLTSNNSKNKNSPTNKILLKGRSIDKVGIKRFINRMESSLQWKNIRLLDMKWNGSKASGIYEFKLMAEFNTTE